RDEYVLTAKASARVRITKHHRQVKVYLSASSKDLDTVERLRNMLLALGLEAVDESGLQVGEQSQSRINAELEQADALIVLLGKDSYSSPRVDYEVEQFIRYGLRTEAPKPIIPILLPGSDQVPTRLANYQYIVIEPNRPLDEALERA